MKISFLGGAGTVTGSKYLLEYSGKKFLVDCGLFQGYKELRLKNWAEMQFDASEIEAVILTHAHLDHSGYLPLLVKNGFTGNIYCTSGTLALCKILLPDSGRIQQEDADNANRHDYSKHHPALPLYSEEDAYEALNYFKPIGFDKSYNLSEHLNFSLKRNGHIIGSTSAMINFAGKKLVFSGDLGRLNDPIMRAPEHQEQADFLVIESTYGDRNHKDINPQNQLEKIINETIARGGKVIIPSFAIGRAQTLIYYISNLISEGKIPKNLPIYLDSPMATDATEIFEAFPDYHKLSYKICKKTFGSVTYVKSISDSKKLMLSKEPSVIISASGMATGGRILHHLEYNAPDEKNTIILAGFQAGGTRGHRIFLREKQIKIHGKMIPINAKVEVLENISAHADASELLTWLKSFKTKPQTFITHGEPESSIALKEKIEKKFGWNCVIPKMNDIYEL